MTEIQLIGADYDKSRSSGKKSLLGGSSLLASSTSSTPAEVQPLVPLQTAVSKVSTAKANAVTSATQEYDKLTDPAEPVPTPPVQAARLSGLLKSLASAEGAVAESIKARRALIEGLEKMLNHNRTSLTTEESQHATLSERKATIEARKREVEDGIMRGLAEESSPGNRTPGVDDGMFGSPATRDPNSTEPPPPAMDEPSSPSVEALTPTGSPLPGATAKPPSAEPVPAAPLEQHPAETAAAPAMPDPGAGSDLLSSLSLIQGRLPAGSPGVGVNGGTAKKRKLNEGDDMNGLGGLGGGGGDALDGLDDEVADILRRDSGGL